MRLHFSTYRTQPEKARDIDLEITLLGTGNAAVTECYNTCFVLEDAGQYLMVDGGGGNEVLHRLKAAGYDWKDMRHIFVTHKHIDHLLGIVWMIRLITQNMHRGKYDGEAWIYAHDEVVDILTKIAEMVLEKKTLHFIGERLHFVTLADGNEFEAMGHRFRVFDIQSTKAKQYGFSVEYGGGKKLTCCGDEPYCDYEEPYAAGSDWLLHEAFCLYSQADIFDPYKKNHSTVKDACELAERLGVKNLILYHTEDKNIRNRKKLYTAEGKQYYHGNLFVPDDMEVISLD